MYDVYGRRQTSKIISNCLFLSYNINHTEIDKCLLPYIANTNILTRLYKQLGTDGKTFIFAVYPTRVPL